jgi:hypothetical protein
MHLAPEVKSLSESEDVDVGLFCADGQSEDSDREAGVCERPVGEEAAESIAYMHPFVDSKSGTFRLATALLWARKASRYGRLGEAGALRRRNQRPARTMGLSTDTASG